MDWFDDSDTKLWPFSRQPPAFRRMIVGHVAAALVLAVICVVLLDRPRLDTRAAQAVIWLGLAGVAVETYRVSPWTRRRSDHERNLWSTAIAFAAVLVGGPLGVPVWTVTSAIGIWKLGRLRPWRFLFNVAQYTLQGVAAAFVAAALLPRFGSPEQLATAHHWRIIPISLAAAAAASIPSAVALGGADVAHARRTPGAALRAWVAHGPWLFLVAFAAGPLLALIAVEAAPLLLLAVPLLVALLDVSARAESASARAARDPLTGLASRYGLEVELTVRLRDPVGTPMLMLIDLDHFKQINDSYGHVEGDRVLVDVAERLRACSRGTDLLARIGGDEFALLASPTTDVESARALAQRMIDALGPPFAVAGTRVSVGASIGIAAAEPRQDLRTLVEHADAAMYRAKRSGGGVAVCERITARRAAHWNPGPEADSMGP